MKSDEIAEKFKNEGNQHFKEANYEQAIDLYSQAIQNASGKPLFQP